MLGETGSVQFSTGHTVDTKGTSPLENVECVRACPALPATEMSICALMSFSILISREQFARR